MQQVWGLSLDYLPALELALKSKWDKSGDSLTHWELFWRLERSIRFFNDLFGFIELPIVVIRGRKFFHKWNGMLRNFKFIMTLNLELWFSLLFPLQKNNAIYFFLNQQFIIQST